MKVNGMYHQGCLIDGQYCKLNRYYIGCKKCIKYKPKLRDR